MSKPISTSDRLKAFLEAHPKASAEYSLTDIGRELGVSRERIRQLLPDYVKTRPRRMSNVGRELREFVAMTPAALLPTNRGGLSFANIAGALGCSISTLRQAWRELRLPERPRAKLTRAERVERERPWRARAKTRWRAEHKERAREIQRAASLRWAQKVVGDEICVWCGCRYLVTNRKRHDEHRRGQRKVCGTACGRRAGAAARQLSSRTPSVAEAWACPAVVPNAATDC